MGKACAFKVLASLLGPPCGAGWVNKVVMQQYSVVLGSIPLTLPAVSAQEVIVGAGTSSRSVTRALRILRPGD